MTMASKKIVEQDARFAETMYVVESDAHFLWVENQRRSDSNAMYWEQESLGKMVEIGKFHGHPIVLTFFWYLLDGHRVAFWECTSQVCHHGMIERWLRKNLAPRTSDGRLAHTNALNFHHVVGEVKERGMKRGYVPGPRAEKSLYVKREKATCK